MSFGPIKYRRGYKYQIACSTQGQTPIIPIKPIDTEFIKLSAEGYMFIKSGYAWDGASGPTIDTSNTMVPSLVHDAFCQLIRLGYLPDSARIEADNFFFVLLREEERKMWIVRAKIWLRGVRFGAKHHKQKPKKVYTAP